MFSRVTRTAAIVAIVLAASVVTSFLLNGKFNGMTFHHSLIAYAGLGLLVQQLQGARLRAVRLQAARARVNNNRRGQYKSSKRR